MSDGLDGPDNPDNLGWLWDLLACPVHGEALTLEPGPHGEERVCGQGCRYSMVHSVPVLLPADTQSVTHEVFSKTLDAVADGRAWQDFGDDASPGDGVIDPWVQRMVGHTNSNLYTHLIDQLPRYPLPESVFPEQDGILLDIGCGWGRWSLAAALAGQRVVGIDPSLGSVLAARRVAAQLGVADRAAFVVADARHLPFADGVFRRAYSYSVLQHFSKQVVVETLRSLHRTSEPGAETRLHLLNTFGLRSLQVQLMRGFREAADFEVRYWRPGEMRRVFAQELGASHLEVDGFFMQARPQDRELLTKGGRRLLDASQMLTRWSRYVPPLRGLADNLFVVSHVSK